MVEGVKQSHQQTCEMNLLGGTILELQNHGPALEEPWGEGQKCCCPTQYHTHMHSLQPRLTQFLQS